MANFVPTLGFVNCPKCNGWQVIDKTPRKPNGWPLGGFNYIDCDNCFGRGEVRATDGVKYWPVAPEAAWQIPIPKPIAPVAEVVVVAPAPVKVPVTIDDNVAMPAEPAWQCFHENRIIVWGREKCNDCQEYI